MVRASEAAAMARRREVVLYMVKLLTNPEGFIRSVAAAESGGGRNRCP
jgi:hypothetical protein